ncbi:methionyl-tRNA synthetase [Coemansia sp. RSA 486]|nr:methionyl-tRNA synthetase [Coemansia sp. RSA 486]
MIRNGGIANDGDYSSEEVVVRYKKDLVGQLANLASRCLSDRLGADLALFAKIADQQQQASPDKRDLELRDALVALPDKVKQQFDKSEFGRGLSYIFDTLAVANKHISDNEPWKLVKNDDAESQARLQVVLFYSLEAVRIAAIMLQPVMPDKTSLLLDHLHVARQDRDWSKTRFGSGWTGVSSDSADIEKPKESISQLFPKLA